MKKWLQKAKIHAYRSRIFDIYKVTFASQDSEKSGEFDVLETRNWANIVPITKDNQVVMVRQFRFGSQELSLEFPAGVIEVGEDPKDAVIRELKEETGCVAELVEKTGECRPNPAFLNNHCYHFVAKGVEQISGQNLDAMEEIEIVTIPFAEIPRMIQLGEINHAHSITAWYFFQQQ